MNCLARLVASEDPDTEPRALVHGQDNHRAEADALGELLALEDYCLLLDDGDNLAFLLEHVCHIGFF